MNKLCQLKSLNILGKCNKVCITCSWFVDIYEIQQAQNNQRQYKKEIQQRNELGFRITDYTSTAKKLKYVKKG